MRTALIFAMLVAWAAPAGAQERLADQLRKGVVEEEVNQNTGKAIQAYQTIVARYDEDRKAAGTALYRLAECYRKTGKREQAIAAYQRVTREFADQAAIAEPSRQQLAALGVTEPREVRPSRASTTGARAPRETRFEPALRQRAPQAEDTTEAAKLEIELKAMQRRLAETENLIQKGLLAPVDYEKLKAEYAALQLRYQQQLEESQAKAREAQDRRLLNERMMKSVEEEIKLVQQRIKSIEQNVKIGKVSEMDPELLQLRRDLLGLQRKLDELRLGQKLIR